MDQDEAPVDETVMLTRRGRRRRADAATAAPAPTDAVSTGIDENTVVVDRRRALGAPDAAGGVDAGDDVDEHTVVLDRRPGRDMAADAGDDVDEYTDVDEHTVVLDRRPGRDTAAAADVESVDERTVVVDRRRPVAPDPAVAGGEDEVERTVVVDRRRPVVPGPVLEAVAEDGAVDEHTVDDRTAVVARDRPAPVASSAVADDAEEDLDVTIPAPPSRRTAIPSIYKPRAAPRAPQRPPVVSGAAAPTRVVDPEAPSLTRRARRLSLYAVVSVVASFAVSVVGLTALGFLVFG